MVGRVTGAAGAPRYLVIGASGLIGRRFLRAVGPASATGTFLTRPFPGGVRFDMTQGGIGELLARLPGDFTHAVVMGGNSTIDRCARDPEGTARVNVTGPCCLIDELLERNITPIFTSTDGVYDGSHGLWREDQPAQPILTYARQKLEVEQHLAAQNCPWLAVRVAKVLDAEGDPTAVLAPWIADLRSGRLIRCATDQRFSPVGADDVIAAIRGLAEAGVSGVYNLGGGEALSRWDLLAMLVVALERVHPIAPRIEASSIRDFPFAEPRPLDTSMDIGKLVAAISYRPESLEGLCARAVASAY